MNLELQEFPNPQTGNIAQVLIDPGGCCVYYEECCHKSVVKAGLDEEEMYWATWALDEDLMYWTACTSDDGILSLKVNDHACLDDALSALEAEMEKSLKPMPWHSEIMSM